MWHKNNPPGVNQAKAFLLAAIAVSSALSLFVLLPFVEYALGAVLLAYLSYPLKERLEDSVGTVAACSLLVATAVVALVLPLAVLTAVVIRDAVEIARNADNIAVDISEIEALIEGHTGYPIEVVATVERLAEGFASALLGNLSGFFGLVTRLTLGVMLLVFLMYYILKDGEEFVAWSKGVAPLPDEISGRLYRRLSEVTRAVLRGHILVALIQALLAGAGLAVAGVPNFLFWTFMMVFLAVLPVIGVFLVWGPASVYLFATGSTVAGVGVAVYGTVVVSISDNYLRLILVDRGTGLKPGVILVGVLGGIYAMGVVGLFVGPVVLGSLKATLTVYKNNYDSL